MSVEEIGKEIERSKKALKAAGLHLVKSGKINAKYSEILRREQDDRYLHDKELM